MCKILYKVFFFIVIVVKIITGHPVKDELMFNISDDTAVVESTVREARAAVPEHIEDLLEPGVKEAFLHTYGDDEKNDGDVHGYRKKSQDKGNDGYKHYDSYHKKDGDKYGYETHSEYGQENKAKANNKNKSGKYSLGYDSEDGAETKDSYKTAENDDGQKNHVQAIESFDGDDFGFYADSGESYFEDDADDDKESEGYEADEGYGEEDGDSGDGAAYTEAEDDGDVESYEYDDY